MKSGFNTVLPPRELKKTNLKETDFQIQKCHRKCVCSTSLAFASSEKVVKDTIVKKYAKTNSVKIKASAEKDTLKYAESSCHKRDADLKVIVPTNTHHFHRLGRKII